MSNREDLFGAIVLIVCSTQGVIMVFSFGYQTVRDAVI